MRSSLRFPTSGTACQAACALYSGSLLPACVIVFVCFKKQTAQHFIFNGCRDIILWSMYYLENYANMKNNLKTLINVFGYGFYL